ncbi:TetR family transcriptional regulator [Stenotrophomonas sp. 24(2023)]|uniref:TetR family transcriptional regulator n=1 Tax=Stenotrophomonas sp. 24(2023) TaxID=3068324 RepID=UPI0027E04811|nr:TetR family transcriptional regulator [Stenotrophomonas sp. 24(2023)]WMJ70484.1 TetR family transcriptional regulator [Stenotrophomonas sp. 24(2023)]
MSTPATPQISSRKQPRQARSNELVAVILEAAAQVLAQQGAARFTTARVAERAGVSIGSLYQYFPNKAAILFRLQADEWAQNTAVLRRTLQEGHAPPLQRLRALVHAFIRSECEEVEMRVALSDAAPLYRDAPEARQVRSAGEGMMEAFMREALPAATPQQQALASELIATTLSSVGKRFSSTRPTRADITAYADAVADMFCAYLQSLDAR